MHYWFRFLAGALAGWFCLVIGVAIYRLLGGDHACALFLIFYAGLWAIGIGQSVAEALGLSRSQLDLNRKFYFRNAFRFVGNIVPLVFMPDLIWLRIVVVAWFATVPTTIVLLAIAWRDSTATRENELLNQQELSG